MLKCTVYINSDGGSLQSKMSKLKQGYIFLFITLLIWQVMQPYDLRVSSISFNLSSKHSGEHRLNALSTSYFIKPALWVTGLFELKSRYSLFIHVLCNIIPDTCIQFIHVICTIGTICSHYYNRNSDSSFIVQKRDAKVNF